MLEKCIGALTEAIPNHGESFSMSILNRKREKKERNKKEREWKKKDKKRKRVEKREILERMLTRLLSMLSRYGWPIKLRLKIS